MKLGERSNRNFESQRYRVNGLSLTKLQKQKSSHICNSKLQDTGTWRPMATIKLFMSSFNNTVCKR